MKTKRNLILALSLLTVMVYGQKKEENLRTLFTNVSVFDGRNDAIIKNANVIFSHVLTFLL